MQRQIIETPVEAINAIEQYDFTRVAFDVETLTTNYYDRWCHGGNYEEGKPTGISFFNGERALYIDTCGWGDSDIKSFFRVLKRCWKSERIIAHNIVFDLGCLYKYGVKAYKFKLFDTLVAAHLVDENRSAKGRNGLKFLAKDLLGEEEVIPWTQARFDKQVFQEYAVNDAVWAWQLADIFTQELQVQGLETLFYKIEMPYQVCLLQMLVTGVLVDLERIHKTARELEEASAHAEMNLLNYLEEPYELLDVDGPTQVASEINFNSYNQLREILFDRLGLEPVEYTKTGNPSTGKATLKAYENHEFIKLLKKYKIIRKLLTAFFEPLPSMVDPDMRLRPDFRDTGTVTGRLSCRNPNLQQLPKVNSAFPVDTRACFICPEGYKMVAVDFSQQETRIMAELSQDPTLISILRDGGDIHLFSANSVFSLGIPEEKMYTTNPHYEETKKKYKSYRNKGKVFSFGVPYGMAQPLDAKILTPSGWKRMKRMREGDEVFTADGSITTVTGVFPQGKKEVYQITMTDGSTTQACKDHLWTLQTAYDRQKGTSRTITTEELSTKLRKGKQYNCSIDRPSPVMFPIRNLKLHPWVLGFYLGDGDSGNRITKTDVNKIKKFESLLPKGCSLTQIADISYSVTSGKGRGINPFLNEMRKLNLDKCRAWEKFIPTNYLYSSIEDREALLEGLLASDGTPNHNSWEYCTSSPQLVKDVQFLVKSLGGRCTMTSRQASYKGKVGRTSYRLFISMGEIAQRNMVQSVKAVGEKECQCISVSHPSGLYITDDFIVTHNSEYKAAKDFGITPEEGKKLLDNFFAGFPELKKAIDRTHKEAEKNGYVATYTGRRRRFEKNKWGKLWPADLRQSFNFLIQGFGADLIRIASIRLLQYSQKNKHMDIKQIMSVHDEVVFYVKEEYAEEAAEACKRLFEQSWNLCVPLESTADVVDNYGDAK